jgi:hypothetical protein
MVDLLKIGLMILVSVTHFLNMGKQWNWRNSPTSVPVFESKIKNTGSQLKNQVSFGFAIPAMICCTGIKGDSVGFDDNFSGFPTLHLLLRTDNPLNMYYLSDINVYMVIYIVQLKQNVAPLNVPWPTTNGVMLHIVVGFF